MRWKPRHCVRLPPCPAYDVEGTESWLESMAAEGWQLSEDGFVLGWAVFQRSEPVRLRCRLAAAPESTSMWSEGGGLPSREILELGEADGWRYVANRGEFYIFVSQREDAREMDTDPRVQALALELVRGRLRAGLIQTLVWMAVYPLLQIQGNVLLLAIDMGSGLFSLFLLLVLWALANSVAQLLHLRRLERRLRAGEPLKHRRDWRRRARLHQGQRAVFWGLALLCVVLVGCRWSDSVMEADRQPLEGWNRPLPFATLESVTEEGTFVPQEMGSLGNWIEVKQDWLAPEVISLRQCGWGLLPGGQALDGALYVDYCQARTPWLARMLAREWQRQDWWENRRRTQPLDLPGLGVDWAAAYQAYFPTVILVEDNRVIRITFLSFSEENPSVEAWAELFAEAFVAAGEKS